MVEPELVATRLVDAVESGKREFFVPRWYRIFALAQAVFPASWPGSCAARATAGLFSPSGRLATGPNPKAPFAHQKAQHRWLSTTVRRVRPGSLLMPVAIS